MKNQHFLLFISITFLFLGFTLGFLFGKNRSGETVTVSVPHAMQTLPLQTMASDGEIVFPIDLNKADMEELMALPGVGEILAFRILAYRRERGSFHALSDLEKIEGIDEALLEDILDLIYVGG